MASSSSPACGALAAECIDTAPCSLVTAPPWLVVWGFNLSCTSWACMQTHACSGRDTALNSYLAASCYPGDTSLLTSA